MNHFEKVKSYLTDLGLPIIEENAEEQLVVVEDQSQGLHNMIVDCEEPLVIVEQFIFRFKGTPSADVLLKLLQMNRTLVHGAFVVDESGENVIFRDTLQIANLDLNELEATVNALSMAMAEYSVDLINFSN